MVEEQLQSIQIAGIVPIELEYAEQLPSDLSTSRYSPIPVNGPSGKEPVWTHNEGSNVVIAKLVELDQVQHVCLYRRVEGIGWEGKMSDSVAVDSRLAGWGMSNGV